MQRSTLNCNVPLTGYSRTYRYAFIYEYIYIYISTLAEKSLEIYISSSERLKEGLRAWPEHAHTHIKHTRAPGFVGVGHITSLRRAFEVGGSSKNPFGLQNSVAADSLGWKQRRDDQWRTKALLRTSWIFLCASSSFFCCFFFRASLAHSACWKSLMNQLLSHRVE